ncbi:hypothetical protein N9L76_09315 [bacterium]|nr:hypothetical protein [bacterium]
MKAPKEVPPIAKTTGVSSRTDTRASRSVVTRQSGIILGSPRRSDFLGNPASQVFTKSRSTFAMSHRSLIDKQGSHVTSPIKHQIQHTRRDDEVQETVGTRN